MKTSFLRGLVPLAAGACLSAACSLLNPESSHSSGRDAAGTGDSRKDETSPASGPRVVLTAVSFPEEYDWKRDTASGAVRGARVLLLQGQDTLLCISAGAGTVVGTAPDMIHFIDGHLFTEYSDASSTVICRDGEELFRCPGREMLKGLIVSDGALYTLSQPRSGTGGFRLRRDGELLYERQDGVVAGSVGDPGYGDHGALYRVGDDVVFGFFRDAVTGGREVYLYRKGRPERVQVPSGMAEVYDVRVLDGSICLAGALESGERPVIAKDADIEDLSDSLSEDFIYSMRLEISDGGLGLVGCYRQVYSGHARGRYFDLSCTGRWPPQGGPSLYYGEGYLCTEGDKTVFVRMRDGRVFDITEHNTDHREPPPAYSLYTGRCARLDIGKLYLALTGADGTQPPVLWIDGDSRTVEINGYLAGVYVLR